MNKIQRYMRSILVPLINLILKPNIRYRFVFPLVKLLQPDYDETILEKALRFIQHNGVKGDYLEFGVWKGRSFAKAFNLWSYFFKRKGILKDMLFYAFDSFEGLPELQSKEDIHGEFKKGDYYCSLENFKNNIVARQVDLNRVTIVPGWFDQVLTKETKKTLAIKAAAIIFIDCDLYESTVPVLEFITDYIVDGTILIFDDWFCFKGRPDKGEQKAFADWLIHHPEIGAIEWHRINWKSNSFILYKK